MQKITDDPLEECPSCGGRLNRLISSTSFILKGTGWYVTDYARKEKKETKEKGDGKSDQKASSKTADSSSGDKD
jgi:predicted nucleic acid-binding Zn ribbon protein